MGRRRGRAGPGRGVRSRPRPGSRRWPPRRPASTRSAGRTPRSRPVRRRAGRELDPSIAATFVADGAEILGQSRDGRSARRGPRRRADAGPHRGHVRPAGGGGGHRRPRRSEDDLHPRPLRGVAALASAAAARHGLDEPAVERVRLAGHLHDLGRVGISNAIWERPRRLTAAEWEQVRLHAYHSERILARSEALRPIAAIAGMHHERQDGSGLPPRLAGARHPGRGAPPRRGRRVSGHDPGSPAPRGAQRGAAAAELRREADAGRLDADAASSVRRGSAASSACALGPAGRPASAIARSTSCGSWRPASPTARSRTASSCRRAPPSTTSSTSTPRSASRAVLPRRCSPWSTDSWSDRRRNGQFYRCAPRRVTG